MNVLFVVQRYGREVAGGAEVHCREFATRLAGRGHAVEVATSCALDYADWADHYAPGADELDGVTVHRFSVAHRRDQRLFGPLDARMITPTVTPPFLEREWMRLQGPAVPGLVDWLGQEAGRFDVVVFFTYLYFTTWAGLEAAHGSTALVLHPTAHDEAPLYRRIFDGMFRRPSAFAFSTDEEERLVRRRFRAVQPSSIIGVGTDVDVTGDSGRFREAYGLGERPYLAYVGRYDSGKAADELSAYFLAFKERNGGPLALAIVGKAVQEPPDHPDVVVTGFVDDQTKHDALAGALALVQPSYFESFSMVLTEAWVHGVPALVQGRCDVLDGQVRRSGGGVPYSGFAEFEVAVDLLLAEPGLTAGLGRRGRRYVEEHYRWDVVMDRYERFLADTVSTT